jgi:RNA polymerase-binding transcription factor
MSRVTVSTVARPWPWLVARRSAVVQLVQTLRSAEKDEFGVPSADVVGASDDLDVAISVQGRVSAMLRADLLAENERQIEHAMERAAEGRYGRCEDCGSTIPAERLKAWPEATRCVECQRRHEQRPFS